MTGIQSEIDALLQLGGPSPVTDIQGEITALLAPHDPLAPPTTGQKAKAIFDQPRVPEAIPGRAFGPATEVDAALFADVKPAPQSAQEIALERQPEPVPAGNAALRFVEGISREAGDKPVLLMTNLLRQGAEFLGKTQFSNVVGPTDKAVEFFKDFGEFQEHELSKRSGVQGVAGKAGEFVGFMFNPIYIGAFGLAGRLTGPIVKAIAGKVGKAAFEAALKAGATPETARRAVAWREFGVKLIAAGPEGALAFGTIKGIEGLGEGGREGMIDGIIQGAKIGLFVGPLFRLAGAAIKKGLLEPMQGRNARRALGLPATGKLTAEEIERAWRKAATAEGVTGDQFIRLAIAQERLVHPGKTLATSTAEKAAALAPPEAPAVAPARSPVHALTKRDAQSVLKFRGKVKQGDSTFGIVEGPEGFRTTTRATTARAAKAEAHEAQVNAAANTGEPIPFEVRQEFPDIQFDALSVAGEAVAKPVVGGARVAPEARPKQGGPRKGEMTPEAQAAVESKAQMSAEDVIKNPPLKVRRGFLSLAPLRAIQRFWVKNLLSRGDLPLKVFNAKIASDGEFNALVKQTQFTLRDFRKSMRAVFGLEGATEAEMEIIGKALKGEVGLMGKFAPLKPVIKQMRTEIDALSQRGIDIGLFQGPLRMTVENNKGFYTTRTYKVHTDPRWAKSVPLDVRNKAKAMLRAEYPNRTEEQIQGLIDNLLVEGKAAETPFAALKKVFGSSKLGSKDLSIVKRREDIPPEIRALWGEQKDPRVLYVQTVNKLGKLIANQRFLETVKREGLGKIFFKLPETNPNGTFNVRIAADQSNVMAPLNGLYTTTTIKEAFEAALGPGSQPGRAFRHYMKINGTVKLAKTVASVQTHVRNLIGNTGFAVANGHWRVWNAKGSLRAVATDIGAADWLNAMGVGKFDIQAARDYVIKLRRLGVIHESTRAGELLDVMKDAGRSDVETFTESMVKRSVKNTLGIFPTLYRLEDDVWKVFAFENEFARYTKAFPTAPRAEIEAQVANIVRNTYPTYSLVPRGIKMLRRMPLIGKFPSFPAEVIRTGGNVINLIYKELRNPATREIGMERLAGTMTAALGTSILATTAAHLAGVTVEYIADMRRFLPDWSKNSQLVVLPSTPEGNPRYIDLSYVDPYEHLKKPLIAIMNGVEEDEVLQGLLEATVETFEPFFGEEILAGRLVDIARNVNGETGGKLWNEEDDPHSKLWDASKHILSAVNPGTARTMFRVHKGLGDQPGLGGLELDAKTEAIGALTGQRLTILKRKRNYGFAVRNRLKELRNADGLLGAVAQDRSKNPMPEEELVEAYNKAEDARREIFEEMVKDSEAIQRLGLPISTVQQIMKTSKMSREQMGRVLLGLYMPRIPDARFLDSFFASVTVAADSPEERIVAQTEVIRRKQIIQRAAIARLQQFQQEQMTQPSSP